MENNNCDCQKFKLEKVTKTIRIAGQSILLENMQAMVCQDCGVSTIAGRANASLLEKKLLN